MPKPAFIAEARRILLRNGFGRDYAARTARELFEHWEDLVDEELRQGVARAEAEAAAAARMGSGKTIAEELARRMRGASLLGRFPTAGFALLALAATCVWWGALLAAAGTFTGMISWTSNANEGPPPKMDVILSLVDWIRSGSYVVVPLLICFVAKRYFCGWQAALWGCLALAIHNAAHFFRVTSEGEHGTVAWGYGFSLNGPELLPIAAPIAIFALYWIWNARRQNDGDDPGMRLC